MKALTLLQPWASLIAIGAKRIETRSWRTSYRGPLAIHAGRTFGAWSQEHWTMPACRAALYEAGITGVADLPRGYVIAVCRLVDCLRITEPPPEPERSFGVYAPGRFAWVLEDPQPLAQPMPVRGMLGLWECALEIPEQDCAGRVPW